MERTLKNVLVENYLGLPKCYFNVTCYDFALQNNPPYKRTYAVYAANHVVASGSCLTAVLDKLELQFDVVGYEDSPHCEDNTLFDRILKEERYENDTQRGISSIFIKRKIV